MVGFETCSLRTRKQPQCFNERNESPAAKGPGVVLFHLLETAAFPGTADLMLMPRTEV